MEGILYLLCQVGHIKCIELQVNAIRNGKDYGENDRSDCTAMKISEPVAKRSRYICQYMSCFTIWIEGEH